MKIYIGKHIKWWGPYQIADLLQKIGVSEDKCFEIGKWLSNTKLYAVCKWIHSKRNRKIKIKIHNYDAWNADNTIGIVIHHVMKEYLRQNNVTGYMDIEDVPECFHEEYNSRNEYERGYCNSAWKWLIGEIIWATDPEFEKHNPIETYSYDLEKELHARRQHAMNLFGKYFFAFWN